MNRFILTVTPDISVSTALAYSLVKPSGEQNVPLHETLLKLGGDFSSYNRAITNDFETPVFERFPVIARIKGEMISAGADFALMSGSGSSVYGFFRTDPDARKTLASIQAKFTLRAGDVTPPQAS